MSLSIYQNKGVGSPCISKTLLITRISVCLGPNRTISEVRVIIHSHLLIQLVVICHAKHPEIGFRMLFTTLTRRAFLSGPSPSPIGRTDNWLVTSPHDIRLVLTMAGDCCACFAFFRSCIDGFSFWHLRYILQMGICGCEVNSY